MRKKLLTIILFITVLLLVSPVNTKAFSFGSPKNEFSVIYHLQSTNDSSVQGFMNDYDKSQNCSGGNSLLGDPSDPNSVAWLLQQVLDFIKVVGPILVVVLSSIDFAKVIVKSDDEAMGKARKKLITRLALAALLFFIPMLVTVMLDLFGLTSESTCGLN